jgi:hypothetical protein
MKLFPISFLVASTLGLVACGGLADDTQKPGALATMNGTLAVRNGATAPGAVRVALVWSTEGRDKSVPRYNVAEDLEVAPAFPARFELTLRNPPPAEALVLLERTDMPVAVGSVVAYEDKNGNGKLDLVDANASSFVDGIVGTNDDLLVVWLSQEPSAKLVAEVRDPQGGIPHAGYNLYRYHRSLCSVSSGGNGGDVASPGAPTPSGIRPLTEPVGTGCEPNVTAWLPIDSPFDLPITNDPKFNQLMCRRKDGGSTPSSPDAPPPVSSSSPSPAPRAPEQPQSYPLPGAKGLVCSADGRSFTQTFCPEQKGLCPTGDTACEARVEILAPGAPVPAGWPCAVP